MGLRKALGLPGYNELAEARAKEIDEVLAEVLQPPFVDEETPMRIGNAFASIFIAYAGLAARDGGRVVVFANSVYDRAEQAGLIGWAKTRYPTLDIQRASTVRGMREVSADLCIFDEAAEFNTNPMTYRLPE